MPLVLSKRRTVLYIVALYSTALIAWYSVYPQKSSSPIDELVVAILFVFNIKAFLSHKNTGVYAALLGYFLVSLGGALAYDSSLPQPDAAIHDFFLDLKLILLFIIFRHLISLSTNTEFFFCSLSKLLLFISLLNIPFVAYDVVTLQTIHGESVGLRNGMPQPMGLYHHTTESAWRFLLGYISALYLTTKHRHKIIYTGLSASLFLVILFHASAKETVILMMVTISYFFVNRKISTQALKPHFLLISFISLSLFFSIAGEVVLNRINLFISKEAATTTARTALYLSSAKIAADKFPLGVGGGNFASMPSFTYGYSSAYREYGMESIWGATEDMNSFLMDAHWPKIIGQGGVLGFFFYLLILKRIFFFRALKALRRSYENWFIGNAALMVLITSFASSPFTNEFLMFFLALTLALLANLRNQP